MSEELLRKPTTPEPPDTSEVNQPVGVPVTLSTFGLGDFQVRSNPTESTIPASLTLTGGGGATDAGLARVGDASNETTDGSSPTDTGNADDAKVAQYLQYILSQSNDQSDPNQEKFDPRWNAILNDTSIDRSHIDNTDGHGNQLWDRSTDEVQNIEVRKGHQPGDPPANYVIDKNGKVHELISPNKKATGAGDNQVVIEFDDSEQASASAANAQQVSAANRIIAEIQANTPAGLAPDIPSEILNMLVARDVPAPRPIVRGGPGGVPSVAGFSNGGNYSGPPSGGFSRPSIPTRMPSGVDSGGNVHAQVAPAESSLKDLISGIHGDAKHNPETIKKIVQQVVGKNEGHPTSINWNDNGSGVSVGIFQWNQKAGELPMLLQRMAKDHPEEFKKAFGSDAEKMTNENFIRSANISPNSRLGGELQTALNDPVLQQTQVQLASEKVANCMDVCKQHNISSEANVALFTDLVNQFGMGDARRGATKYLLAAEGQGGSEEQKFSALFNTSKQNSYRVARNDQVLREIKDAGLSFQAGSAFSNGNTNPYRKSDGSQNA